MSWSDRIFPRENTHRRGDRPLQFLLSSPVPSRSRLSGAARRRLAQSLERWLTHDAVASFSMAAGGGHFSGRRRREPGHRATARRPPPEPTSTAAAASSPAIAATTTVARVNDIAVDVRAVQDRVFAGERAGYRVTVRNNGPSSADQVLLTTELPPDLTSILSGGPGNAMSLVPAAIPPGCTATGLTATCPLGALAIGQTVTLEFSGRVPALTPAGTSLLAERPCPRAARTPWRPTIATRTRSSSSLGPLRRRPLPPSRPARAEVEADSPSPAWPCSDCSPPEPRSSHLGAA
jgi:uncharacterized repeat protein (TIGR01451 family)